MMLLLGLMCLSFTEQPTPPAGPAPWIASLLAYEQQHGRDAWSWQQLQTARRAVYDSQLPSSLLPGWLQQLYIGYLEWYPIVVILMTLAGCYLTWRCWCRHQPGRGIFWALVWFVLVWLGLELTHGSRHPVAVIKQNGTVMREGNGASYRAVQYEGQAWMLAAGEEAELHAERDNGWVQLERGGVILGWVPLDSVYQVK